MQSPTSQRSCSSSSLSALIQQKNASPKTISSYRDTFRLFLQFTQRRLRKPPAEIELTDLNTSLVSSFLDHLEKDRHNTIRSRNARFAALRSFPDFAGLKLRGIRHDWCGPRHTDETLRAASVGYLSREEIEALLNAPDPGTWCGQRDRVMLATLYNTGARVSELIGMTVGDVVLDRSSSIRISWQGQGEMKTVAAYGARPRTETTIVVTPKSAAVRS